MLSIFSLGTILLNADEGGVISSEDARIRERMTAKGFTCRNNPVNGSGQRAEINIAMDKNTVYYIALITGRGENAARTAGLSLLNQRKHVKKPEFQNTTFGTEVSMKPNSDGNKLLKFELTKKSDFRITTCVIQGSLYRIDQGLPAIQDFGSF